MTVSEARVGCGAAIIERGHVLLLRRKRPPEEGCWGLPGGKVDPFETLPAAVRREVAEELGLDISPHDLLCVVDQIDREQGTHWVAPVYLVTAFEGEPRLMEPHKHAAFDWFPLDALPQPLTEATRVAIRALEAREHAQG